MDEFLIVRSHPDMLAYVDQLQRTNANSLAFVPIRRLEKEIASGNIFLGLLNTMPCGYLYMGTQSNRVTIHQACIQYDARLCRYGAMLVVAVEDHANHRGAKLITLSCGFDLEANDFWQSLGYNCIKIRQGGVRRMRKINIWRKNLAPTLFEDETIEPAKGKASATIWTKHKQTGMVSQFHRGKSLTDYRAHLIEQDEGEL